MLVMRRFKSGEEAMKYFTGTRKNGGDFLPETSESYTVYPVSQTNYREILKARSLAGYGEWFAANY